MTSKYIDKYMLLNVDCISQNESRRRNISLFDNLSFIHLLNQYINEYYVVLYEFSAESSRIYF